LRVPSARAWSSSDAACAYRPFAYSAHA